MSPTNPTGPNRPEDNSNNPQDRTAKGPSQEESPSNRAPTRRKIRIRVGANRSSVMGAAIGAAGWIIGLAIALALKGFRYEATVTGLCAAAVLAVGYLIVARATRGQLISIFHAIILLLGSSFLFGLSALLILHTRDVLEPVVDPDGSFTTIWNFGALFILLLMIGIAYTPPIRKFLSRHFV